MNFINPDGILSAMFTGLTNDITGSLFLSYLLIIFFIMVFMGAFRIPIEYSVLIVFPLLGVVLAFNGDFIGVTGAFALYIAVIIAKNYFITRA